MTLKIILTEDDPSLGQTLSERLKKENFEVHWARSLAEAKPLLAGEYDLAILDLGLPDGSGFDLAMDVKRRGRPLIIMTAQNTAENRLEAYELGSEEFIPKPFHFRELLLRINHMMEFHSGKADLKVIDLPSGQLDLERMCFTDESGGITFFAPKDFRVLQMLIEHSPKPVHRDEILDKVWGLDNFPTQRTIDNAIVRIRQTIRDDEGAIVRSVRGVGYQWVKNLNEDAT